MEKFPQLSLPALLSILSLTVAQVSSLQIHPKPCRNSFGDTGTCMFVWDCIKTEGNHLGTCVDRFLVGSCCSHNDRTNVVPGSGIGDTGKKPSPGTTLTTLPPTTHSYKPSSTSALPEKSTTVRYKPTSTPHKTSSSVSSHTTPSFVKSTTASTTIRPQTSPSFPTTSTTTVESSTQHRSTQTLETTTQRSTSKTTTVHPLFTGRPSWKPQSTSSTTTTTTTSTTTKRPENPTKTTAHSQITGRPSWKPQLTSPTTTPKPTRQPIKSTTTAKPSSVTILRPGVSIVGGMQVTSSIPTTRKPTTHSSTATAGTSTKISTSPPTRWTTKNPPVFSVSTPGLPLQSPTTPFVVRPPLSPQVSWKPIIVTASKPAGVKGTTPVSPLASTEATTPGSITCGVPAPHPQQKVVGGKNSAFGAWPWQASVRRTSFFGFSSTHRCGGALISRQWVATAGHCVDDLMLSQIRIRVGEYDFSSVQEPYGYVEKGAKRKVVHPKYNFFTYENDLALVQLEEPIEAEKLPHITPICLPSTEEDLVGKNATVTGWGRLSEGGVLPSILQEVQVPIISNEKCKNMFLAAGRHEYIPEIFMCAGFEEGGRDSCQGDSGGPLQLQAEDGHWFLAGIISWGIGCAEPNMPGVCTRISKFKDWVLQQIT